MKNSVVCALSCFAISILATGCSRPTAPKTDNGSQAAVQVPNPGFETGTLVPWKTWQAVQATVTGDNAHSGKFSVAESGDGTGSVYIDISGLQPGVEYTVSAWACAQPGTKAHAQIAVYDPQSNIATFSQPVLPSTQWQQVTEPVKAGAKGIIRLHLFHNQGIGTIYWDDVQVVPTA